MCSQEDANELRHIKPYPSLLSPTNNSYCHSRDARWEINHIVAGPNHHIDPVTNEETKWYKVRWKNFPASCDTMVSQSELKKTAPKLLQDYSDKKK